MFQRARVIFRVAEEDGGEKEFESDPRDMENRRGDAGLNLLDDDVAEAGALEFAGERLDLTQSIDDPAIAKSAIDGSLRAAQFSCTEEAVGNHEAASRPEKAVRFADQSGLVCAGAVTTALDCVDGVEGFGWEAGVFVVAEVQGDVCRI